nr:reverse transcriptase domain, reverse transcriptase zinc-binding domain protein [Tanacetum cinerariifolium]
MSTCISVLFATQPLCNKVVAHVVYHNNFLDSLRLRADVIDWYHVVWFFNCIPRHDIHLWLVVKEKLKTQDRLRKWDVGPSTDLNLLRCPLYDMVPHSHSHLFFECSFSSQVWMQVKSLAGMDTIPPRLTDVMEFLISISKGRSFVSVISRLLFDGPSYYLWGERNARLFKKKTSTVLQIIEAITGIVRLNLVTFKFKKISTRARILLDSWKIPSSSILVEGSSRVSGWISSFYCVDYVAYVMAFAYVYEQHDTVSHDQENEEKKESPNSRNPANLTCREFWQQKEQGNCNGKVYTPTKVGGT